MWDRVEAAALPVLSPRGLMYIGVGRWGSLAGMGGNSVYGESGGFVPAEVVAEDPPLWSSAHAQGIGEQEPLTYTPPPLGGESLGKFGSPGMMGDDDGRAPLRRDATNLNPPPRTTSSLEGDS